MKTLPLGPFLGINNRLPDFALHKPKVGDFLRLAVNVDITNSGNIKRRKATALLADIRSQRNSATPMARIFPTQSDLAGLAQQSAVMLTSVTSFWVEYVVAMASCHVRVMSAASLPYLKPPSREAPPSNWL